MRKSYSKLPRKLVGTSCDSLLEGFTLFVCPLSLSTIVWTIHALVVEMSTRLVLMHSQLIIGFSVLGTAMISLNNYIVEYPQDWESSNMHALSEVRASLYSYTACSHTHSSMLCFCCLSIVLVLIAILEPTLFGSLVEYHTTAFALDGAIGGHSLLWYVMVHSP